MGKTDEIKKIEADKHAIQIFEERNRAFRVLYDTVLKVEGVSDERVFSILCRNLMQISNSEYAALISYDKAAGTMTLEAVNVAVDSSVVECRESIGKTIPVSNEFAEVFLNTPVKQCPGGHTCLMKGFSCSAFNTRPSASGVQRYHLSCVRERELVAAAVIQLPPGRKLRVKDMIGTYLNTAGLIIQRMNAVNALRNAHNQNKFLLASISSILVAADEKGKITQWNAAAEKAFGILAADVKGRPFSEIGIRWDADIVCRPVSECIETGRPTRVDAVHLRFADGRDGRLDITVNPIKGEDSGFLLLGRDVTERKKMEERLVQSEKLISIGQLAAGFAHEINNPTGFVAGNLCTLKGYSADLAAVMGECRKLISACSVLEGEAGESAGKAGRLWQENDIDYILSDLDNLVKESMEGTGRIKKIVGDLQNLSSTDECRVEMVDINKTLDKTLGIVFFKIRHKAGVEKKFGDVPHVLCSPVQIEQAFLNVLVNAAQAIEDRGIITIKTFTDGGDVCIEITDTGTGISPDIQKRIFDPFFTTRPVGSGTGLGLHIAYNIIKHNKGDITVRSKPGEGATFTIRLPIPVEQEEHQGASRDALEKAE